MEIRNHIYNFSVEPKATGKRIKELRKAKGLTAEQLAEKLYRSTKAISSWETGARFPSIDNLVDLANLFEVSVHSLMLPNDNCEVACLENIKCKTSGNSLYEKYSLDEITDNTLANLLVREEYLIQRFISGAFTRENEFEFSEAMREAFGDLLLYESNNSDSKPICNTAEAYFDLIKSFKKRYKFFHVLLNRLWHGENFNSTLSSLNRFEKDVMLTTCLYFEELRNTNYAIHLYNNGARFINCDFKANYSKIQEGVKDSPDKKIFNKFVLSVNSDSDLYRILGVEDKSEEEIISMLKFLNMPLFSDDPSYYSQGLKFLGMCENETCDMKVREKLSAFYYLLDFIRDSATSFGTYISNVIEQNNMEYNAYVCSLKEGGLIP